MNHATVRYTHAPGFGVFLQLFQRLNNLLHLLETSAYRSDFVVVGVLQLGLAVLLGVRDVLAQRLLRQDVRVRMRRRLRLRPKAPLVTVA